MNASRFLLPLLIVAALYFLFLRPQKNRQKAAAALSRDITPGQRVVTTAGMYATVVELDDAGVLLEIAPGVQVRYVRQAISRVVEPELAEEAEETDSEYADGEYPEGEYEGEYADGEYPEGGYADDDPAADDEDADAPDHIHAGATAVDLTKDPALSGGALPDGVLPERGAADQAHR